MVMVGRMGFVGGNGGWEMGVEVGVGGGGGGLEDLWGFFTGL